MRSVWGDLRFCFRVLRNSPASTVVAILTLALGLAANITVFSWIASVLLDPLPGVQSSHELAVIEGVSAQREFVTSSIVEYRHYREGLRLVSGTIAGHFTTLSMGAREDAGRVWGELVSDNYFSVLGVKPIIGRVFNPGEFGDTPGSSPMAVLSERLWRSRFAADPAIAGKTVRFNRVPVTVIGVVPAEFRGTTNGLAYDVWLPLPMAAELRIMNDAAFRRSRPEGSTCWRG